MSHIIRCYYTLMIWQKEIHALENIYFYAPNYRGKMIPLDLERRVIEAKQKVWTFHYL